MCRAPPSCLGKVTGGLPVTLQCGWPNTAPHAMHAMPLLGAIVQMPVPTA